MSCTVKLKGIKLVGSALYSNKIILMSFSRGFAVSSITRAVKEEFPIKWVRPEKLKFYDPRSTGDLKPLAPIDNNKLPRAFEGLEELKDAHPLVRKVFTVGFLGRRFGTQRLLEETLDSVKAHEFDDVSQEVKIARQTHKIRNIQAHLERVGNDPQSRMVINELIHRRKRFLCLLRERDYKKFEWLLDKIDLEFKPHPAEGYIRIERKASIRKLTNIYCDNILRKKWQDYEDHLENQKLDFLKKKVETLKWVRQEQLDCKVEPSVNEEDIQKAEERLAAFQEAWEAKEKLKPAPKVRK